MPGRPILFDLQCRNQTICRTCLLSLRKGPATQAQPWIARYSTQRPSGGRARRGRVPVRLNKVPLKAATQEPTRAELQQAVDELNPTGEEVGESADFDARFYEQEGNQMKEVSPEAYEQGLMGLDASPLKDSAYDIRRVLKKKVQRQTFDEVVEEMGPSWENMHTTGDVEDVVAKLNKYDQDIDRQIEEQLEELPDEVRDSWLERFAKYVPGLRRKTPAPPRATVPQISLRLFTANQRRKVSRLNSLAEQVLRDVHVNGEMTQKHVVSVYKAYHAARKSLAHSWDSVPVDMWDFVWKVFSADESINPHRLAHISMLAVDMSDAKVELSPPQQLATVEAVFVEGFESKALDNWKRCMPSLGAEDAETFKDFWELGVRMYCQTGDMDQAQRAVDKLLKQHSDPRILMPIMRTWSERGTPEGHEHAWNAYWQMRELLGPDMKLSDHDKIVSVFLASNQIENALYAFVDMMSDGQINLRKQKYMPSVVANKFFLGKWLKRLIGAGDLNGAHKVVDFMCSKGVQCAPIQLNGLIGAYHRAGGAGNVELADNLAWGMIKSRIDFVTARREGAVDSYHTKGPVPLPRATLETFSLLAENYRSRDLHSRLDELWQAFTDAEICPDSFMMNQILESYIQGNQIEQATNLYNSLVKKRGIKPDPYTYSAMWKTLGVSRFHRIRPEDRKREIRATRAMFAETAKHREDAFPSEGMDGQLARKILHSFRQLSDDAGFLVALTSLKEIFNFLPTELLVLELVIGTTRLSWDQPTHRRKLMHAKRTLDFDLAKWAEDDKSKIEGDRRAIALYEYLQRRHWPSGGQEERRKEFIRTAKEMGVYEALSPKAKEK